MDVLITGGSGLIGRALTAELVKYGDRVVILSRRPDKMKNLSPGVRTAVWDGKSAQGWGHLINEVDAVVNLAGASIAGNSPLSMRWTKKRKAQIRSSRINAGKAVLEAIISAEKKPEVLVQASAIGYYGYHGDQPIEEDSPAGSDFLAQLSIEWESGTKLVEDQGVRHLVIRTGLVLSSAGGVMPLFKMQFGLFAGGRMGSGRQYYSWIHVADQVGAIVYLLKTKSTSGAYNLTAPQPETNQDFSRILGKVMRRPSVVPVPEFALRAALGEVADLTVKGQRVLPRRLLEAGYLFQFPNLESAFVDLLKS
ncbi:MAG: TIGR01777 family oxidoreductase [Chloroflexota bacterium]